ncbi:MAG: DMT family transporter [Pseudomonadota bacterium]
MSHPASPTVDHQSNNVRGATLMVGAMLFFAIEDAMIKRLSDTVPLWLIFAVLGVGSATLFALILIRRGLPLWSDGYLSGAVILRNVAEAVGAWAFVSALALVPLATASAILQAAPILVAMGAALFLGEAVGLRRWIAIGTGFCGVLLIIRPGMDGFDANVLYAVLGVIGLALRDLATRRVPGNVHSLQLSMLGFLSLLPVAIVMWASDATPLGPLTAIELGILAVMLPIGMLAYAAITVAGRTGEVGFVTPFRYSRMVFALIIGIAAFAEIPDTLTLVGVAIIICSGLYTLWRERVRKSAPAT